MKRRLLTSVALVAMAGSAIAADIPSIKSAPVASPAPMCTGFYAGLNAGGTWANDSSINASTWSPISRISPALFSGSFPTDPSIGFIGGGQIGYNRQLTLIGAGFIAGVEADIQGIVGSGGAQTTLSFANYQRFGSSQRTYSFTQASTFLDYIGTVRGRLGYLVSPSLLIYGTGGLGYGGINLNLRNLQTNTDIPNTIMVGNSGVSNTQLGWAAGGGVEWMFASSWSAKAEYLYYDLGSTNAAMYNTNYYNNYPPITNSVTQFSTRIYGNIIRAGVNYHFNFASTPVVAKY
jgi:outer membrane immunogenic protein